LFADRVDAGQRLGANLREFLERECAGDETVVLALPRGGVPVGYQVAKALGSSLDVFVVRKLGTPQQPELAMGAIASGGVRVINEEVVFALRITPEQLVETAERETRELERREHAYRGDRVPIVVKDKCILLVDDGVATGYTMRAAVAETHDVRPHTIALVRAGSIPKTSSGKIQRRECRAALVAGTLGEIGKSVLPEDEPAAWIAPRTPVEEALLNGHGELAPAHVSGVGGLRHAIPVDHRFRAKVGSVDGQHECRTACGGVVWSELGDRGRGSRDGRSHLGAVSASEGESDQCDERGCGERFQ